MIKSKEQREKKLKKNELNFRDLSGNINQPNISIMKVSGYFTYMWNIKQKVTNNKTNKNKLRNRQQNGGFQNGRNVGGG